MEDGWQVGGYRPKAVFTRLELCLQKREQFTFRPSRQAPGQLSYLHAGQLLVAIKQIEAIEKSIT